MKSNLWCAFLTCAGLVVYLGIMAVCMNWMLDGTGPWRFVIGGPTLFAEAVLWVWSRSTWLN
jgi:hypothetical protein